MISGYSFCYQLHSIMTFGPFNDFLFFDPSNVPWKGDAESYIYMGFIYLISDSKEGIPLPKNIVWR